MKLAGKTFPKEYIDQLIVDYGKSVVSDALTMIDLVGEFDGAWSMSEDMGMLEQHDVIDELMNFNMEDYYS